jgi:hypothetical protein
MAREKELTSDDKFEMLLSALLESKSTALSKDDLRSLLVETSQATAGAMQKALKPENTEHPNISVFRPKGGKDPVLPYDIFYNGFPIHKAVETHHDRELELLLQVEPGEYTVIRKDITPMAVSVTAERDANGKITKLEIRFPVTREEKALIPAMHVLLYQIVHAHEGTPKQVFVKATQDHMALLLEGVA